MGFAELFEIGFFTAFFIWSNFGLTVAVYLGVALSFALQYILLKKCRRAVTRYWTYFLDIIGIFICEVWWHFSSGWDRLAVDIIYGFFVCMLIGHLLAAGIYRIRARKSSSKDDA